MSNFLFIAIVLILAHTVIRRTKSRRRQNCSDSNTSTCQTAGEDQNIPRHKSILAFCIFASIFWITGVPLLCVGYKNISYSREFTEQGNKAIATITDVHEYEVSDGDGDYSDARDVYITYMADGQKYDNIIEKANIYGPVGKQIEIYYSSEDPTVIISPEDIKDKVSFQIPMGVIMIALPFLMLIGGKIISR